VHTRFWHDVVALSQNWPEPQVMTSKESVPCALHCRRSAPTQNFALGTHVSDEHALLMHFIDEAAQSMVEMMLMPSAAHVVSRSPWHAVDPGWQSHGVHAATLPLAWQVDCEGHGVEAPQCAPSLEQLTTALSWHLEDPPSQTSGAHEPDSQCEISGHCSSLKHSTHMPATLSQSLPSGVHWLSDSQWTRSLQL
jgi:hypothetical protein